MEKKTKTIDQILILMQEVSETVERLNQELLENEYHDEAVSNALEALDAKIQILIGDINGLSVTWSKDKMEMMGRISLLEERLQKVEDSLPPKNPPFTPTINPDSGVIAHRPVPDPFSGAINVPTPSGILTFTVGNADDLSS
jgi:hypothetical protein